MEELSIIGETGQVHSVLLFVLLLIVSIVVGRLFEAKGWLNESVTALLIGLATGGTILATTQGTYSRILQFDEQFFFIYLLPPIIFNAGFKVEKKLFFKNIFPILAYGVVGTLLSFSTVAFGVSYLFQKLNIGPLESHDYSAIGAILSATDSVCALQVLNQNETPLLYSLIFGERVVNDATSVVIFNAIRKLNLHRLQSDTMLQFLGDLLALLGKSTLLGVVVGSANAFIVKKMFSVDKHSTPLEVALMALMGFFSYVAAECLDLSGILAVFFCAIVMSHYTLPSVTKNSRVIATHGFATLSFIAESFIFLYVGMDALDIEKWMLVSDNPGKLVGASAILLALVLLGRAAFVFPLSFVINLTRQSDKISFKQQIIIWWAGLMRGAVSMALAYHQFTRLGHTRLPGHALMITSTITIVLFSTMVFGMLTKPLIRFSMFSSSAVLPVSYAPPSPNSLPEPLLGHRHDGDRHSMLDY